MESAQFSTCLRISFLLTQELCEVGYFLESIQVVYNIENILSTVVINRDCGEPHEFLLHFVGAKWVLWLSLRELNRCAKFVSVLGGYRNVRRYFWYVAVIEVIRLLVGFDYHSFSKC